MLISAHGAVAGKETPDISHLGVLGEAARDRIQLAAHPPAREPTREIIESAGGGLGRPVYRFHVQASTSEPHAITQREPAAVRERFDDSPHPQCRRYGAETWRPTAPRRGHDQDDAAGPDRIRCVDFSVWAPERERVRVVVGGETHEMARDGAGWWHATVDRAVGAGGAYAFLLDEEDTPLPDPRSRWQPAGVHGASRVYDHGAFGWTDQAWTGRALPGSVLYELHIGTFTPGAPSTPRSSGWTTWSSWESTWSR